MSVEDIFKRKGPYALLSFRTPGCEHGMTFESEEKAREFLSVAIPDRKAQYAEMAQNPLGNYVPDPRIDESSVQIVVKQP